MLIKKIPSYPDYEISENGDIFSNKYGMVSKLKPIIYDDGYHKIALYKGKKRNCLCVHRLVLMTFDRMPKGNEQARHFPDDNKSNNHISNLRWGTPKQNCHDRDKFHKTGKTPDNSNENNGQCKLSNKQVQEIRDLYSAGNITHQVLADRYSVSRRNVGFIVNNKSRTLP